MLRHVLRYNFTHVSQMLSASIVRLIITHGFDDGGTKHLKRRPVSTRLHVATSQKTAIFILVVVGPRNVIVSCYLMFP
jgi:hypothetical protein